MQLIVQM